MTRKKRFEQKEFLAVLKVVEEFQVVRIFEVRREHKAGKKPDDHFWEVIQLFIVPEGPLGIVARNRQIHWNMDTFTGYLEIRSNLSINDKYDIAPTKVLPGAKCLPIYKRNGFRNNFHWCRPYNFFRHLIESTRVETLLKARQFDLMGVACSWSHRGDRVRRYWDSIKICIRNNYCVKDSDTWFDYLDLLGYFGKDLRNPVYVCPKNLKQAHDRLVIKKRIAEAKREEENQRKRLETYQANYEAQKKVFFGLSFRHGNILIKVLEHVKEFMEEGDIHRHCVFTNNYFDKPDSLIFSAKVKGHPVETVEVSLSEMKVVQARGFKNEPSKYHDDIVSLMNRNMYKIREIRSKDERGTA